MTSVGLGSSCMDAPHPAPQSQLKSLASFAHQVSGETEAPPGLNQWARGEILS